MAIEENSEVLLARQSIVDRQGLCIGYELLFRGRRLGAAEVDDDFACTMTVVQNMLGTIGMDNMLGENYGFLNCSSEFLASDHLIDILPARRMVLEILETCELNEALAQRCVFLRHKGFRIALDDVRELSPQVQVFLQYVDMVKIDWPFVGPDVAARITAAAHAANVEVLAEKVETREDYVRALEIGCDLFQGFYFTRPQLIKGNKASVNSSGLLGILDLVLHEANINDIERALRSTPSLAVQILRIANSSSRWRTHTSEITSIRQALSLVGLKQLARLCGLMLYGADVDGKADPLAQLVMRRADFMERVAQRIAPEDKGLQQEAYLSALLSLAHIPQGMDARDFIDGIAVGPAIRDAIIGHDGRLGLLLEVAECVEKGRFPAEATLAKLLPEGKPPSLLDGLSL